MPVLRDATLCSLIITNQILKWGGARDVQRSARCVILCDMPVARRRPVGLGRDGRGA